LLLILLLIIITVIVGNDQYSYLSETAFYAKNAKLFNLDTHELNRLNLLRSKYVNINSALKKLSTPTIILDSNPYSIEYDTAESKANEIGDNYDDRIYIYANGHRIIDGDGIVFANRGYSRKLLSLSGGSFQRISIYFPKNHMAAAYEKRNVDVGIGSPIYAFYSGGSAGHMINTCYGYSVAGTWNLVDKSKDYIKADIDIAFILVKSFSGIYCGIYQLKRTVTFNMKNIEELKGFVGKKNIREVVEDVAR